MGIATRNFFVPGMVCGAWAYRDQLTALNAELIDLSDPRFYPDPDATTIRDLALIVIEALGNPGDTAPIALFGHSMGGYVLLEVLQAMHETGFNMGRLTGIGIIGATMLGDTPDRKAARLAQLELVSREGMAPLVDVLLKVWFSESYARSHDKEISSIRHHLLEDYQGIEHVFRAQSYAAISRPTYDVAALAALVPQCSLGFLWGADDAIFDAESLGKELDLCSPTVETALVSNSGHMVTVEQPETINRLLSRFTVGERDRLTH